MAHKHDIPSRERRDTQIQDTHMKTSQGAPDESSMKKAWRACQWLIFLNSGLLEQNSRISKPILVSSLELYRDCKKDTCFAGVIKRLQRRHSLRWSYTEIARKTLTSLDPCPVAKLPHVCRCPCWVLVQALGHLEACIHPVLICEWAVRLE